jgi:hypothetical protein
MDACRIHTENAWRFKLFLYGDHARINHFNYDLKKTE